MENRGLGEMLRAAREEAGFSREVLAAQTKIPLRLLAALEDGRGDELPAPVYVRGFIRSYCAAVGVDPLPALDMLTMQDPVGDNEVAGLTGTLDVPIVLYGRSQGSPSRGFRLSHVGLLLLAVVILLAAWIIAGGRGEGQGPSTASTVEHPSAVERVVPAAPSRDSRASGLD